MAEMAPSRTTLGYGPSDRRAMWHRHWATSSGPADNTADRVLEWIDTAQDANRSWARNMLTGIVVLLALLWLVAGLVG